MPEENTDTKNGKGPLGDEHFTTQPY